jgi:hypothetical protein
MAPGGQFTNQRMMRTASKPCNSVRCSGSSADDLPQDLHTGRPVIWWQGSDAAPDQRHRRAGLDVGPIREGKCHQDDVKTSQNQPATNGSPSLKL